MVLLVIVMLPASTQEEATLPSAAPQLPRAAEGRQLGFQGKRDVFIAALRGGFIVAPTQSAPSSPGGEEKPLVY